MTLEVEKYILGSDAKNENRNNTPATLELVEYLLKHRRVFENSSSSCPVLKLI
jgi:primosomal replication protein N